MQYKQKADQYRVSIRRKDLNERMARMRAKCNDQYEEVQDPQKMVERIAGILENSESCYKHVREIKLSSQNGQVMSYLKSKFQVFYRMITEIDLVQDFTDKSKFTEKELAYNDLATVLINITSEQFINFTQQITEDIASPLLKNIRIPKREICIIWLLSNILYRHNQFAGYFMHMLSKWGLSNYLKERLNMPFNSEIDMTIFYYFVGAVTANLDYLQSFNEYKEVLAVLQQYSQMEIEELYWYQLDGLMEHAYSFGKFQYEIFRTKLLERCEHYCKTKKSRFVVKYLQLIAHFLQGESQVINKISEQGRKKAQVDQYERLKTNLILKNLQFCLENRSPQVKRLLFEIAYMLISLYPREISFMDEYFYLTLAEEIKGIEKHEERGVIWFLKYFSMLICSLLMDGSVTNSKEYTQAFINFVESTGLFEKIDLLMQAFGRSTEILSISMDVIAYLLDYHIPSVNAALRRVKLIATLEDLEAEGEISHKRDRLLEVLTQEESL